MPNPQIDRVSPSVGWPGVGSVDGTSVIVHGRGFHPTHEMQKNRVRFIGDDFSIVEAPVKWTSVPASEYVANNTVISGTAIGRSFTNSHGVAIDNNGQIFVTDTENHRIIRIDTNTIFGGFSSGTWGEFGSANGEFNRPTGIAVDADGFVYVSDSENHRIQKFDSAGNFQRAWGTKGKLLGQYDRPTDVDIASVGGTKFVYVADSGNKRVQRTDENGQSPTQLQVRQPSGRIIGVSAPKSHNGFGYVYATEPSRSRIHRWTWNGIDVGTYGAASHPHINAYADLEFPMGIEQGFDGYVYVADNGSRTVKKFDQFSSDFRLIGEFGISVPAAPGMPLPKTEFGDVIDVAVTSTGLAYGLDRRQGKIVRYEPTEAQEIWVNVPEGAATGTIRVDTDEGFATAPFTVLKRGPIQVSGLYLTQGLDNYPLVAGKRTMVRCVLDSPTGAKPGLYGWGSPAHDTATCTVVVQGEPPEIITGKPVHQTYSHNASAPVVGNEIQFEIPEWVVNQPGHYELNIELQRTGNTPFSFTQAITGDFTNRRTYKILAAPVSHLNVFGQRVTPGPTKPVLYSMNPRKSLNWVDWEQLYTGYATYNRLYPVRTSVADVRQYFTWIHSGMADGITSKNEIIEILGVLERTRKRVSKDSGIKYDYIVGIVDRDEIKGDVADFNGATTSAAAGAALVSIGEPVNGFPPMDVGTIIAHELLHLNGEHHQQQNQIAEHTQDAWNSFTGAFIRDPMAAMYEPEEFDGRNDWNSFVEGTVGGSPGPYFTLFDNLANPHPRKPKRLEASLGSVGAPERLSNCSRVFTLVGTIDRSGVFQHLDSWAEDDAPVTIPAEKSDVELQFRDAAGELLLGWNATVSFDAGDSRNNEAGDTDEPPVSVVSITSPLPDSAETIELVCGDSQAWTLSIPRSVPEVSDLNVQISEQRIELGWSAHHPSGAGMTFSVDVSFDQGASYSPVAVGVSGNNLTIDGNIVSPTESVIFRVTATDGIREATAESGEIIVGKAPGRAVIVLPSNGQPIVEGKRLLLRAMASKPDGTFEILDRNNTRWILDDEVQLGLGNNLEILETEIFTPNGSVRMPIPVGEHKLTVVIKIPGGEKLTAQTHFLVVADSDRDGVSDDLERAAGTDPFEPGQTLVGSNGSILGQWISSDDRWSEFEFSQQNDGELLLEIGLIQQDGQPFANQVVTIVGDQGTIQSGTDGDGWVRLSIGSQQTVLVRISQSKKGSTKFGWSKVRIARESHVQDAYIQVQGWVHRMNRFLWWRKISSGAIRIADGGEIHLRTRGSAQPTITHRLNISDRTDVLRERLRHAVQLIKTNFRHGEFTVKSDE